MSNSLNSKYIFTNSQQLNYKLPIIQSENDQATVTDAFG